MKMYASELKYRVCVYHAGASTPGWGKTVVVGTGLAHAAARALCRHVGKLLPTGFIVDYQ